MTRTSTQDWGEPGLTPAERVIGWNTLEVLSLAAGNPDTPVNAIPGSAHAHCQLRFVVGTDVAAWPAALRAHLDRHGFGMVAVEPGHLMNATRTDPDDPWVRFALASLERTEGTPPALLPNLGGSLPNDAFADELGMPDHLDPALLPGLRPARPGRAPARAAGPPGAAADGRTVLGPRRPLRLRRWRWLARLLYDVGDDGAAVSPAGRCTAISPPSRNPADSPRLSPLQKLPGSYRPGRRPPGSSPMAW